MKYFSIGNIAKGELIADFSAIDFDISAALYPQSAIPVELNKKTRKKEPLYDKKLQKPDK